MHNVIYVRKQNSNYVLKNDKSQRVTFCNVHSLSSFLRGREKEKGKGQKNCRTDEDHL